MIRAQSGQAFGSGKEPIGIGGVKLKLELPPMKLTVSLVLFLSSALAQPPSPRGFVPKEGFVPNETVALAIAEAVLIPVYGKSVIDSERPFKAALKSNIWTITGSVPCDGPPGAVCPGGAAELRISKRTGRILFMTHYQ